MGNLKENKTTSKWKWILNAILTFVPLLTVVISWFSLPPKVPTNFNFDASPDLWGGKWEWLVLACIVTGLFLLVSVTLRHRVFEASENGRSKRQISESQRSNIYLSVLLIIQFVVDLLILWILVESQKLAEINITGAGVSSIECASIGVIMMCIGSIMPMPGAEPIVGIHIPGLKQSTEPRSRLNKIMSRITFSCGIIIVVCSLFWLHGTAAFICTLSLLVLPTVLAFVLSCIPHFNY